MVKIDLLQEIPYFNSLTQDQLGRVSQHAEYIRYDKKDRIYDYNDSFNSVYFVKSGAIKLGTDVDQDKALVKHISYENDIFGENIFSGNKRTEYAEVLRDASVIRLDVDVFKSLLTQNNHFATVITEVIIERINTLEKRMKNFIFMKAQNRITGFLKEVAQLKGIKIGMDEVLINHGMSHKDISFMTDTSRQTVTRVLAELKSDQIIHFSARKPSKILIRNMAAL